LPHFDVSLDVFLELVHVLLELGGQGNLRDGGHVIIGIDDGDPAAMPPSSRES
jgi:hypothetical protein